MSKIAIFEHLRTCSEAAKKFTYGLVGELAQTVMEAMEEMESIKANKEELNVVRDALNEKAASNHTHDFSQLNIKDKSTNKNYTFSMDNGLVFLDDGDGEEI